jgi:hypothetical protein
LPATPAPEALYLPRGSKEICLCFAGTQAGIKRLSTPSKLRNAAAHINALDNVRLP